MWRLGDREAVAECLEGLAALAGAQGEPSTAGRLFGAAEALRGALGKPVDPPDRPRYDRDVATARAQLDPSAFAAAWADGRGAPLDEVIAGALSETEAGARAGKATERGDGLVLSAREREVALLLAQGLTNRQIADDLVVARSTVDRHVVNILRKLDLTSRAQVAVWAVEHRLESAPR
jgi:DNA-binding NarL/FixJ family response regulator